MCSPPPLPAPSQDTLHSVNFMRDFLVESSTKQTQLLLWLLLLLLLLLLFKRKCNPYFQTIKVQSRKLESHSVSVRLPDNQGESAYKYIDLAKPKSGAHFFFPPTRLNALPRPELEPRSSNSEPSAQSRGVDMPTVHLTTHVKSSTLYGRTVVHPNLISLMGYYYFV